MELLLIWIFYAVVSLLLFTALFIWAVRAGQFRDQERARYLPLQHPPQEEESSLPH